MTSSLSYSRILEDICAGDILLFEDFHSDFFRKTGNALGYVFCVTDKSFIVANDKAKEQGKVPLGYKIEIPFYQIESLRLQFPLAPHGRIYSVSLKKF